MKLFFQHFGSGFPLVILHGLFGSSDNWQSLGKRLGQHFAVYAVDLRNHGNSPHSAEFNYPAMADDLREFLAEHQLARVHVLGHSMGGKVAMQFAQTFSLFVEKLIIADIAPKPYPRSHDHIFRALREVDPGLFSARTDVDKALSTSIPDLATRQFLLKNLASTPAGTLRWKIDIESIFNHYEEILAAQPALTPFSNPTVFIRGGRSNYILKQDEAMIKELFPAARFETLANADHWVHADSPNEFLQAVLGHLKQ